MLASAMSAKAKNDGLFCELYWGTTRRWVSGLALGGRQDRTMRMRQLILWVLSIRSA